MPEDGYYLTHEDWLWFKRMRHWFEAQVDVGRQDRPRPLEGPIPGRRANAILHTTSTGIVGGTTSMLSVDNIDPHWGACPTTSSTVVRKVKNPFKLTGRNNYKCAIEEYCRTELGLTTATTRPWQIYAIVNSSFTVEIDSHISTDHEFQHKTMILRGCIASTSTGWKTFSSGTTCT